MACRLKKFGINYEIYDLDSPVGLLRGPSSAWNLHRNILQRKVVSRHRLFAFYVLISGFYLFCMLRCVSNWHPPPPSPVHTRDPSRDKVCLIGCSIHPRVVPGLACICFLPASRNFLPFDFSFGVAGFSSSSVFSWTCVFRLSFRFCFAPNGSLTLQFSFHFLDTKNLSLGQKGWVLYALTCATLEILVCGGVRGNFNAKWANILVCLLFIWVVFPTHFHRPAGIKRKKGFWTSWIICYPYIFLIVFLLFKISIKYSCNSIIMQKGFGIWNFLKYVLSLYLSLYLFFLNYPINTALSGGSSLNNTSELPPPITKHKLPLARILSDWITTKHLSIDSPKSERGHVKKASKMIALNKESYCLRFPKTENDSHSAGRIRI